MSTGLSPSARRATIALVLVAILALGGAALACAVVIQKGNVRLSVSAETSPSRLPREGTAPISVSLGSAVSATDGRALPALESISIEINRHGQLDSSGLATCKLARIQPASSAAALGACRAALVGRGRFSGSITLSGALDYPISGSLLVFNARQHGRTVLFAHAFADKPIATSFVMVFGLSRIAHGTYGTELRAELTKTLGAKRTLSSIEMTLSRRYWAGGRSHSFLSAGCPAPKGLGIAAFPLARTTFDFRGGKRLAATVIQSCRVR